MEKDIINFEAIGTALTPISTKIYMISVLENGYILADFGK